MKRRLVFALAIAGMALTVSGCTIDDTYATCIDSLDCNDPGDTCYEIDLLDSAGTLGAMCSYTCRSDGQCEFNFGFDGACYAIGRDPTFICYQTCIDDFDCYSREVCIDVLRDDGLVDYICVPDNL